MLGLAVRLALMRDKLFDRLLIKLPWSIAEKTSVSWRPVRVLIKVKQKVFLRNPFAISHFMVTSKFLFKKLQRNEESDWRNINRKNDLRQRG